MSTRPKSRTAFYVGLTSTIALGAGTAVMAIVSSGKHSDYEKALAVPNNKAAIDDARSSTKTTALVADILGVTTAVAGGLTILAYVLTSGTEPVSSTSAKLSEPPKLRVQPFLGLAGGGFSGSF